MQETKKLFLAYRQRVQWVKSNNSRQSTAAAVCNKNTRSSHDEMLPSQKHHSSVIHSLCVMCTLNNVFVKK